MYAIAQSLVEKLANYRLIKWRADRAQNSVGVLQVIVFFVCGAFLAIRGATACAAIYLLEQYEKLWLEDKYYYPLDTLPEFIVLVILLWPAFFARMAQSWPKTLQVSNKHKDKSSDGSTSDRQADYQVTTGQGQHIKREGLSRSYVTEQAADGDDDDDDTNGILFQSE